MPVKRTMTFFLMPAIIVASQVGYLEFAKVSEKANAMVLARILKIKITESRCETRRAYYLRVEKVLTGQVSPGQKLVFSYSDFHYRRAQWFWQDDCLNVSYFIPPLANNMNKEALVKAALKVNQTTFEVLGVTDSP